jgi:hypothetical protein
MDHRSKKQFIEFTIKSVDTFIGKKETKKYNEIYEVESEGTSHFYNVTVTNSQYIMSYSLLEKSWFVLLIAHEIDRNQLKE